MSTAPRLSLVALCLLLTVPATGRAEISDELEKELEGYIDQHLSGGAVEKRAALLTLGFVADSEEQYERLDQHETAQDDTLRLATGLAQLRGGRPDAEEFVVEQLTSRSPLFPVLQEQVAILPDALEADLLDELVDELEAPGEKAVFRHLARKTGELYDLLVEYATSSEGERQKRAVDALASTARRDALDAADELMGAREEASRRRGLELALSISRVSGRQNASNSALKRGLELDDHEMAFRAAERLFELNDRAGVDRLTRMLEEAEKVELKRRAAQLLLRNDISPPSDRIVSVLESAEDPDLRSALRTLAVAGGAEEILDRAHEWFESTKYEERLKAVPVLGAADSERARKLLEKALSEQRTQMRLAAARALGQMADPASLSAIRSAIGAEANVDVKVALIHALGAVGNDEAMQILRFNSRGQKTPVKRAVVDAVERAGRVEGFEILSMFFSARDADLRWRAFRVALDLAPEKAMGQGGMVLLNPPDGFAADLASLSPKTARLVYKRLLRHDNASVRSTALRQTVRIGRPLLPVARGLVQSDELPTGARSDLIQFLRDFHSDEDRPLFGKIARSDAPDALVLEATWALTEYESADLEATYRGFIGGDDSARRAIAVYGLAAASSEE